MTGLRVEIADVALRGFGTLDVDCVRASAARELERALAADPAWPGREGGAVVRAAPMRIAAGAGAEDVGAAIARAVHRSLR